MLSRRVVVALAAAGSWAVVCAIYSILGLAHLYQDVSTPCARPDCPPPRLSSAPFSLTAYAVVIVAFASVVVIAFLALALIVGVRSRTVSGIAAAAVLVTLAASSVSAGPRDGAAAIIWLVGTGGLFWLLAVYPTLTFRPRWVAAPVAIAVMWSIVIAVVSHGSSDEPWSWLEGLVFALALLGILAAQVVRFVTGTDTERRQLQLLLLVLAALILTGIAWIGGTAANPSWGTGSVPAAIAFEWSGLLLLIAASCVAWAVAREGALGIIVNRAVVGALLSGIFFSCYALVVVSVGLLVGGAVPTAAAAFGSAVLFAALARPITRQVESLTYGDDEDPEIVVGMLSARLASADSEDPALPALLSLTCEKLRLEEAQLDPPEGETPPPGVGVVDAVVAGVPHTIWARPVRGTTLTRRTRRALAAAADPLVAAALLDARTEDLRLSRQRLAVTREKERRELRRQLHDDVVPSLAATRHRITAAADAPEASRAGHLAAAIRSIDDTVDALRSLARTMRPPELDSLGLVPALRLFAARMSIPVAVTGQGEELPGSVETTVYRITVEALLNAERHAHATSAEVDLTASPDSVRLVITDDGIGGADGLTWGVGLVSIRERVTELGGRLRITDNRPRGLRLDCRLPLGSGR